MYIVTGGVGFIGSHIAARLLSDGHAVRILDNLSAGSRANLAKLNGEVEVIETRRRCSSRGRSAPGPSRATGRSAPEISGTRSPTLPPHGERWDSRFVSRSAGG